MRDFKVEYTAKNGNRFVGTIKAKNQANALVQVMYKTSEDGIHPSVHRIVVRPLYSTI